LTLADVSASCPSKTAIVAAKEFLLSKLF